MHCMSAQILVCHMQAYETKDSNEGLMSRLREAGSQVLATMREVKMVRSQVCLKNCEGDGLRSEVVELKSRLTVRPAFGCPISITNA